MGRPLVLEHAAELIGMAGPIGPEPPCCIDLPRSIGRSQEFETIAIKSIISRLKRHTCGNWKRCEKTLECWNPIHLETITRGPSKVHRRSEYAPALDLFTFESNIPVYEKLKEKLSKPEYMLRPDSIICSCAQPADVISLYEAQSGFEVAFDSSPIDRDVPGVVRVSDSPAERIVVIPNTCI